jgi:hypothetical protein
MIITNTLALVLALAAPPDQPEQQPAPGTQPDKPQGENKAAQTSAVKSEVIPAMAAIHSTNMAAMALYELTSDETVQREAARNTMKLADAAVEIAQDSAQDLDGMKDLSQEMRTEANTAAKKLGEAAATIDRMQREMGGGKAAITGDDAQTLRKHASQLHGQLLDVERSLEKVAAEYGVPTKLGVPEKSAAKGRGPA